MLVLNSDGRQRARALARAFGVASQPALRIARAILRRIHLTAPHASRETPADCYDLLLLSNHEPWATASRKARLTRPASPQGLKATPSPCVAAVPVTPPPAGLRRRPRHESARSARHENVQASRRSTKRLRLLLEHSEHHMAKSMKCFAEFSNSWLPSFWSRTTGTTRTFKLRGDDLARLVRR